MEEEKKRKERQRHLRAPVWECRLSNNGNFLAKVKIEGGFFTDAGEGNLKVQLQNHRRQGPTPEQRERLK